MAKPGAMVDVVRAKAGTDQFLEKIGFLVAASGRSEACQRMRAVDLPDMLQALSGQCEHFFPTGFAERVAPVVRVHGEARVLGVARFADQGRGQALAVMDVIEAIASLDAQSTRVGGAV